MEQQQRDIVHGYVRLIYKPLIPTEIIEIIYSFYLLVIESSILTNNESLSLYNLLYDALSKQNSNSSKIINLSIDLLFRASENDYSSHKFHQMCDKQGPTFCIIHNEHDHIFGGYTSISWDLNSGFSVADPKSFLFMLRPSVEYCGLRETETNGWEAIWNDKNFGPVFGKGNDLCISHHCSDKNARNTVRNISYNLDIAKMSGGKIAPENCQRL